MPRWTDGKPERKPKPNKPQNKPVNARKNQSRVFIQDKRKRPKKRRLRALKRKPRTKARKQNAKTPPKRAQGVPKTDETAQTRQNGRNREQIHHERRNGAGAGNPQLFVK